jgi:hypothetical protein
MIIEPDTKSLGLDTLAYHADPTYFVPGLSSMLAVNLVRMYDGMMIDHELYKLMIITTSKI